LTQHLQQVKWELIQGKIVRENQLSVTREELMDFARLDIINYYKNEVPEGDEALSKLATALLDDEKYILRITDHILNDKIFELLKTKISTEEKAVDIHEFYHH
jgi:trigger factor